MRALFALVSVAFATVDFVPDQNELANLTSGYNPQLTDNFVPNNFFNNFNFETANDPTHGYVNYVDQNTAQSKGYIKNDTVVYIGCDHSNVASGRGRDSVRLSSKKQWNSGVFIIDLSHMPFGCGTWPAYWTVGPNWPNSGEVDVIEGVNVNVNDATTLHTNGGCDQQHTPTDSFTGHWATGSQNNPSDNCDVNAGDQYSNQGCSIIPNQGNTYGSGFNNNKGGVYAHLWDPAVGIKAWFWTRSAIPADITNGKPQPDNWGKPFAYFVFGQYCSSNHFSNQNVVFDLTFCGDWAGNNFGNDCPGKGSCNSYVQNNPTAFNEAYWTINSLKIYSLN